MSTQLDQVSGRDSGGRITYIKPNQPGYNGDIANAGSPQAQLDATYQAQVSQQQAAQKAADDKKASDAAAAAQATAQAAEKQKQLQTAQTVIQQLNESAARTGSQVAYSITGDEQDNIYIQKTTPSSNGSGASTGNTTGMANPVPGNLRSNSTGQETQGTVQPDQKPYFQTQGDAAQTERLRSEPGSIQEAGFFLLGSTAYGIQNAENTFLHPILALEGTVGSIFDATKSSTIVGGEVAGVPYGLVNPVDFVDKLFIQPIKDNPEKGVGSLASGILIGEAVGGLVRAAPVAFDTVEIATAEGATTIKTIGFEQGTRAQPLASLSPEGIQFGTPEPGVKIQLADLPRPTPQPEGALAGKVFNSYVDSGEVGATKTSSVVTVSKELGGDTGQTVQDVFFNVDGLKNPKRASSTIEKFIADEQGIVYGSASTAQLPPGFRTLSPGDVDTFFPGKTPEQLQPKIAELATRLKASGENVRVSPSNPQIIEFTNTGGKLLEAKTGRGITPDGEEIAPAGFLGIKFANLKEGESPSTVAFGTKGARAIKAGEQLQRKGAASLIASPGVEGGSGAFDMPGLVGKPARALKDNAGFIQSSEGLLELRKGQGAVKRLLNARSTAKATAALEDFKSTFTPEQRAALNEQLKTTTGNERIALPLSKESSGESFQQVRMGRTAVQSPTLTQVKTGRTEVSPGIRQNNDFNRVQKSPSPSLKQVSPSPKVFINSPSPSPSFSGRSPSPTIPKSPSPSFGKPAKSPGTSSRSSFGGGGPISPSPGLPSPGSPSPGYSPSPSPSLSPSPKPPRSPSPNIFKETQKSVTPKLPEFGRSPKTEAGFDVFVRRGGKFSRVDAQPLTKGSALKLGATEARNSAARSFKIEQSGTRVKGQTQIPQLNDFYSSRKEPGVFIQKNKSAGSSTLHSAGELREITFEGVKANRRRGFL